MSDTTTRRGRPLDPELQAWIDSLVQKHGTDGAFRLLGFSRSVFARLLARLPVYSGTFALVREKRRELSAEAEAQTRAA